MYVDMGTNGYSVLNALFVVSRNFESDGAGTVTGGVFLPHERGRRLTAISAYEM